MTRLLRIAWRDYLAYVRTPGFWLSILLLPASLSVFIGARSWISSSTPPPAVAVLDFTGRGFDAAVSAALKPKPGDTPDARLAATPGGPYTTPEDALARLKPIVAGDQRSRPIDAAVIVRPVGADGAAVDILSRNVIDPAVGRIARRAVEDHLRRDALLKAGVPANALAAIDARTAQLTVYAARGAGKVSLRDRLPGIAGFAMGMLLWMVVLTGAGMLLNSVIEEKSSRILEVLLSSASVPEIMGGKILGVACVTGTVLGFWLTVGGTVLTLTVPQVARDLMAVLLAHGMLGYLALYFVGGYLMFATLYVTIGAYCETTREAQTLLGPMMIVLSMPVVFLSQAILHPESPLLQTLSWIPIFTPFMMAARVATDPPWWEIIGTAGSMFALTALELWVAIPAFKSGALSTGRFELKTFISGLLRREVAA